MLTIRSSVPPTFEKPWTTPWRSRDEASWTCAEDLLPHLELGFPGKHVERVDVVGMAVQRDSFELGAEAQLDHLVLGKLGQDAVMTLPTREQLAAVGAEGRDSAGRHGCRITSRPAGRA